jgi:hypothetical protein
MGMAARGTLPAGDVADRRRASLAAIRRREWLLQMLAVAAAGCARRDDRDGARGTTVTIAYE